MQCVCEVKEPWENKIKKQTILSLSATSRRHTMITINHSVSLSSGGNVTKDKRIDNIREEIITTTTRKQKQIKHNYKITCNKFEL